MSIEPDVKNVPKVASEHWGLISFCMKNPGTDWRKRLCQYYKINKKSSKEITDHLDKYENAV